MAIPNKVVRKIAQQPVSTEKEAIGTAAKKALNEAQILYNKGTKESQQQAIVKYQTALKLWQQIGNKVSESLTLLSIGRIYQNLGEPQQALKFYNQVLSLSREIGDRNREAVILNNIGLVHSNLGEKQLALKYFNQALPLERAVSNRAMEASTLNNIGRVYQDLGEPQLALKYFNQALPLERVVSNRAMEASTLNNIGNVYLDRGDLKQALELFNQALPLNRAVGDRRSEAIILNNIGMVYQNLGESKQAREYYEQALLVNRAVGDRSSEAGTLSNIATIYADLGEKQQALTYYEQSLPLRRVVGDRGGEATTLNNIGRVYQDLGEPQLALKYYDRALMLYREVGDRHGQANILNNIGGIYQESEDQKLAEEYYVKALKLFREVEDRGGEGTTLHNIGTIYFERGDWQQALTYYSQSLALHQAVKSQRGGAYTLTKIGEVYSELGEQQQALKYYNQALPVIRAVGDRRGEATTLYGIAKIERKQHNFPAALNDVEAAIQIVEDLRTKIVSPELRTSYFATQQNIYQFKTDLLMQLHQQNPSKGYNIQALETTDRARARGLVELLTEAKADIRNGIKPELLKRESDLTQRRNALEKQKQSLDSRPVNKSIELQRTEIDQKFATLLQDEQQLRTDIRKDSPRYAALKFPQPLTLQQIQQQVLDNDTLLLAYSLGTDRSFLWLVSKTKVESYELPKRAEIEMQSKNFDNEQERKPGDFPHTPKNQQIGIKLSKTILQPIANKLGNKRLLIVGDGILQQIPFVALPLCKDVTCNESMLLITQHEIVNAPSISTIATLRAEKRDRTPSKTLAVIADPVFTKDDSRLTNLSRQANLPPSAKNSSNNLEQQQLQRSANESGITTFRRLEGTLQEAKNILDLVPPADRIGKFDFDANRAFVLSPELGEYRYISFATHGIFNNKTPELSGLVMSLVDQSGQTENGFLRLNDIFNLKLSADLVVLSACQTGLGKDIKGEGLVGLTRGFMYAGSPRLAVSLWKVSDDATSVLMTKFYTNILKQKLKPAEALRKAQVEMLNDREYSDPYYWAGFTLQGEWR